MTGRVDQSASLPGRVLTFAASYFFLCLVPVFTEFTLVGGLLLADVVDLLTPLVTVILICRVLVASTADARPRTLCVALMILGGVLFVEGHGIHLSANALTRILGEGPSAAQRLAYFYDEVLGHLLWDGGMVLMTVGLAIAALRSMRSEVTKLGLVLPASVMFAFSTFTNSVEGQTVAVVFPSSVAIALLLPLSVRRRGMALRSSSIPLFLSIAYGLASLLFVFWFILNGGFPEFSELGWI